MFLTGCHMAYIVLHCCISVLSLGPFCQRNILCCDVHSSSSSRCSEVSVADCGACGLNAWRCCACASSLMPVCCGVFILVYTTICLMRFSHVVNNRHKQAQASLVGWLCLCCGDIRAGDGQLWLDLLHASTCCNVHSDHLEAPQSAEKCATADVT